MIQKILDDGCNTAYRSFTLENYRNPQAEYRLRRLHKTLKINHGTFNEEFPEQMMASLFINDGNEKVLEIGGNIGRNSLIICKLLQNEKNLVVLESCLDNAKKLEENRNLNNLSFHIEPSALSKKKLIQKGWDTMPYDGNIIPDGYFSVDVIDFQNLEKKYNIVFDTLVLDCEGAFYYIIKDIPEILNNIKLIIMENDYNDINHYNYIKDTLLENNFTSVYTLAGGWGPCYANFFEVWKKM
jgi:FkbM family methyltransferase